MGYHRPVMLTEVLHLLAVRGGGQYLDGTVGGGGHAEAILEAGGPTCRLWGLDRDPEAVAAARARLARFGGQAEVLQVRFDEFSPRWEALGRPQLDGIIIDLGLSSHQLDEAGRGFSFSKDGPLDMRMDRTSGITAAELLAELEVGELAALLRRGEVEQPGRLARVLHDAAVAGALTTTLELAQLVERHQGGRHRFRQPGGRSHHPATLVFQSLRIELNEELPALRQFLDWLPEPLAPGGTLVLLSYHSLEDRQVKQAMQSWSRGCTCPPRLPVCGCGGRSLGRLLTAKAVRPSQAEIATNPRARSAVLRAWQRSG